MDPCRYCADRICCRSMCRQKKKYLDFIEGVADRYVTRQTFNIKKVVVTVNKNGIRREEYR